ncbi:MAG: hypothetical protein GXX79_07900, partial [Actinomycetales bacterium]|nr:hypothetical protein [Actinomycetales bacterium]
AVSYPVYVDNATVATASSTQMVTPSRPPLVCPTTTTTTTTRPPTTTTTTTTSSIPVGAALIDLDFEQAASGVTGWVPDTGLTVTRVEGAAHAGTGSMRVTGQLSSGAGVAHARAYMPQLPSAVYTYSAYVRLPEGQPPVLMRVDTAHTADVLVTDTAWTRLYGYQSLSAPVTSLSLRIIAKPYCGGPMPTEFLVDDAQVVHMGNATLGAIPQVGFDCPMTTTTTVAEGPTCTAVYRVVSSWPGGFLGEVTVAAGVRPIRGWTVGWTFADGQTVQQSWGAGLETAGPAVTAGNLSWNGALDPGARATFGFVGASTGVNGTPTVTCSAS